MEVFVEVCGVVDEGLGGSWGSMEGVPEVFEGDREGGGGGGGEHLKDAI